MKRILTFVLVGSSLLGFGQGYGIEDNFYCKPVPKTKTLEESEAFWKGEVARWRKKVSDEKANAEILYSLAIALHQGNVDDLTEVISLLDQAIEMKPKEAKYYAVRGIVKYNWGAWSPSYDIGEGCPDIRKAKEFGLSQELLSNESMQGIPKHPSCK